MSKTKSVFLNVETLEERVCPAVYFVDNLGDQGIGNAATNSGDLRWCIQQADASVGVFDQIFFGAPPGAGNNLGIGSTNSGSGDSSGTGNSTVTGSGNSTVSGSGDGSGGGTYLSTVTASLPGSGSSTGTGGGYSNPTQPGAGDGGATITGSGSGTGPNSTVAANPFQNGGGLQGVITLNTALPAITDNLDIIANGSTTVTRSQNAANFGIFEVKGTGVSVTISSLTISNGVAGLAGGGGIYNEGCLILNNCIVTNNSAGTGGGIFSENFLTLNNCEVSYNSATNGGGIAIEGSWSNAIQSSKIHDNTASGNGGGVWIQGVAPNAEGNGPQYAVINITSTLINNNSANFGGGIAISGGINGNNALLNLNLCEVNSNQATSGGGIWLYNNLLSVLNTTIDFNNSGDDGNGGGVYITGGQSQMAMTGGEIVLNGSMNDGGGIWEGDGILTLIGVNLNQNYTSNRGGGLFIQGGGASINGGFIQDNTAVDAEDGQGVFVNSTLGALELTVPIIINNSIVYVPL